MSLEVGPRSPQVRAAQRTPSPGSLRTDGESPAITASSTVTTQSPQTSQSPQTGIAAVTLGDIWDGIANFFKSAFTAVANFFGKLFNPSQPETLDKDSTAIAQAYNLLPTKENVMAFLSEAQGYESSGAIGPGASADSVKVLQQALGQLGYTLQASGDFDQATCDAVMDFKRKNGIQQSYKLADGTFAVNEFADQTTLALIQQKLTQKQTAQQPAAQQPAAQQPTAQQPAAQQPTAQQPAAQQPTAQQPAAQQPAAQQPAAQQPTAQQPAAQQPVTPQAPLHGNEAIIKQYNLLPNQENVDAFLNETGAYKTNGTLGPGMEAPADIKELQTILLKWGYSLKANGIYDEATAAAVIRFKQDSGIHQSYKVSDGNWAINEYADQATLTKMMEMVEKDQKPNATTTPNVPSAVPANGTLDAQAIAKQYSLLPTQENVDAFMKELAGYDTNGTLGPGANAPDDIKELQGVLAKWGYKVQSTGQYDEATCQAVLQFKKDNGIKQTYKLADGSDAVNEYAGPDTLSKILERVDRELAAEKNNPVQATTPTQTVAPVQTTVQADLDVAAIAKQYSLLATQENVDAFMKEVGDYEKNGALGPGANAPDDVKELQQILKGWGYSLDVNGQFDEKTSAAILSFKQQNGIHQTYKLADGSFAVNEYADQPTLVKILEKVGG